MASKIQSYHLYVAITPYKVEGVEDQFNELDISAGYTDYTRKFYVNLHPGWKSTFGHGCMIMGDNNPLTASTWVDVKFSERNSQKFINQMGGALELAKDDIAWLFNERKWEPLKQLVKDVALYGYTAMIEERMKSIKNEAMVTAQVEAGRKAEPQVVVKQVDVMGLMGALSTKGEAKLSDFATPVEVNDNANDNANENQNSNETTMEANNMKAADLIGKTIIVGDNIATITIKNADGDKLQGEFKKAGATMGMFMPIALENLRLQIESGVWRLETYPQTPPVMEGSCPADEGEFTEYEEVTDRPTPDPSRDGGEQAGAVNTSEARLSPSTGEREGGLGDLEGSEDPVMQQWREAKAKNPDAVILFRNGNVYVVIADDAEKVSEVAGLQLMPNDSTAICVFPAAELSVVMPKLVRASIRVAIADLVKEEDETAPTEASDAEPATKPSPRRVQPKAVKVEEEPEEPEAPIDNGELTIDNEAAVEMTESRNNDITAEHEPAEDVVVTTEHETTAKVQPKRPSECTLEAKKCAPYIIDQGGASIFVGGNTEKLDEILYLMWGRKRAYQEGENKYCGVQVSRKHKSMLEAILKIA